MNNEENKNTSLNSSYKTFNKICRIQKLIKKESATKKLCKYLLFIL